MNEKVAGIGNWVLFVFSLPSVIIGWGMVILALVLLFAHKPRLAPHGVLVARWRPWFEKRWKYSTTFGRGIIYQKRVADDTPKVIDNRVEKHEMTHIRQMEDACLLAFIIALVVTLVTLNWILGLCLWMSGAVWLTPNFVSALLRGGHVYRDSEHERSAYAQCNERQGVSWLDEHLSKPRTW